MKRTARDTEEQPTTTGPTHDQIAQHAHEVAKAKSILETTSAAQITAHEGVSAT